MMFSQLKKRDKMKTRKSIFLSPELFLKIKSIRNHYCLSNDNKAIYKAIELIAKQIKDYEGDRLHYENTSKRLSHEFTNKIQLTISELLEEENKANKGL